MNTKTNKRIMNAVGDYIESHWWTWYAIATVWGVALLSAAR